VVFRTLAPGCAAADRRALKTRSRERLTARHRRRRVQPDIGVAAEERPAERRVVVAVTRDHVRLDQREIGQGPGRGVLLELREPDEMRRQPVLQPGIADDPGERQAHRLRHVDLPGPAVLLRRSKIVSASLPVNHLLTGLFTTSPDDVAAVQNDRFMNVCDGTSENQWSNTPEPARDAAQHRQLPRRVPGHGRDRTRRRRVPRRGHPPPILNRLWSSITPNSCVLA